ncbi:hypothetical protein ATCC90586_008285 [Pythium insidiosum]|nr:hypothetical protein ATCC90586_008285 [Pythium insidiosum]
MNHLPDKLPGFRRRPLKRGNVLWHAVRKSMPAFVARGPRTRFRQQRAPWIMVDPTTPPKRAWDAMLTAFVLYTTCIVPYRVCFKRDATGLLGVFETMLDCAFFADIVLNFLTGLRLPAGEITYHPPTIARAYLRGWFVVDFFSTIPFDSLSSWFGVGATSSQALEGAKLLRGLKVLRLFKLARIRKVGSMFSSLEDGLYTNQSLLSLTKLALTMLFLSHLVACMWYAIGDARADSWITSIELDVDRPSLAALQYLASMYWAIVTMVTIGYGDIVPTNNLERVVNVAVMAFGVSFFGYVVGTISSLVANLDVAAALHEQRMLLVKEYILSRAIPKPLSRRLRDHFEYYYQNRSVFKEKQILGRLPSALRNEMIHHAHTKLVNNIKYFTLCHESLISDIVSVMKPFCVMKDEYVFVQHEIAAHIFFLLKGKINLVKTSPVSKVELRLATLSVGEHFGELEVCDDDHGNGVRICSAIAKSYCELTFLSRQALSKIGASWPEVLRHFKDAAATASKKMRRRAEGGRSSIGDATTSTSSATSLFETQDDDALASRYVKSSLLAKRSMRAGSRRPLRSARVSPMAGDDADPLGEFSGVEAAAIERGHLPQIQDDERAESFGASEESEESGDGPQGQSDRKEPMMAEATSEETTRALSPPTTDVTPMTSEGAFDRVNTDVESSMSPSPSPSSPSPLGRGRVRLESLTPSDLSRDGLEFKPFDNSARFLVRQKSGVGREKHDTVDGGNEATGAVATATTALSSDKYLIHPQKDNDDDDDDEEEEDDDKEDDGGEENAKPGSAGPSVAPAPEAISTRGRLPSIRQSLSRRFDRSEDGRRSLEEMVAKIRGAPVSAQPKPTFLSEQVMLKGTYILHPQDPVVLAWQLVAGIGILYSIIVVPFRLGFDTDAEGVWRIAEFTIDGFFACDIVVNLRTAFFDDERTLIFDARHIFWRYAKGWLVLDLVSTIPIDEIAVLLAGSHQPVNYLPTKLLRLFRVARLLKLARLIKLSRVFGRLRDSIELSPSTERFLRLLLVMLLFCHWNACGFHAVMLMGESSGFPSWCQVYFEPSSEPCRERIAIQDRYLASMYWAFTTFTTVGYGDIRPSYYSPPELLFVILVIVLNATVFGYVITSVISLITNLNPSDREYRARMTELKDYLRDVGVSQRLAMSVKSHYQHNIMSTSLFPEEKLFDKMSPSLRFDLARLVAGESLFAIPLITVMEDSFKGFVSYALFLMKPLYILRTEMVCRSGGPGVEMYFLVEGECDLINSHTGVGRIVGENAVFEQYALMARPDELYRTVSTVTAISTKCILYSFGIQEFRALEDVSPAVSTYFLSQLAAVLMEDDLYTLTPEQKNSVEMALRNGRAFRSVAEQHQKSRLTSIGNVAMAKLNVPRRRGSEWAPDLLPRLLSKMDDADRDKINTSMSHTREPRPHELKFAMYHN